MVNRMITLPEEMNNRLKDEENASGLIANLLREHYGEAETEELDKKVKSIEKQKSSENNFRKKIILSFQKHRGRVPTEEEIETYMDSIKQNAQTEI